MSYADVAYYTEKFVLVYWPDEDSTTIVRQSAVLKPQASEQARGVSCSVRHGRQVYDGRIAGIGKLLQTQHTLHAHTLCMLSIYLSICSSDHHF